MFRKFFSTIAPAAFLCDVMKVVKLASVLFFFKSSSDRLASCRFVARSVAVPLIYRGNHRDSSIHVERACQLHDLKMNRRGLLHKG